jgi:hypothetical protein
MNTSLRTYLAARLFIYIWKSHIFNDKMSRLNRESLVWFLGLCSIAVQFIEPRQDFWNLSAYEVEL